MIPCRYVFTALTSLGMIICYALKVNINIAIVSMVNHTAIRLEDNASNNASNVSLNTLSFETIVLRLGDEEGELQTEDGPIRWSRTLQGIIISSYFWGYLFGQMPGGRLAEVFSAKWMFYIGGSVSIVGTLLIPLAAYIHFSLVMIIRITQGITAGFTFPSAHVLLSRWAPPNERSLISTFVYTGTAIGTVLSLLLTGTIAANINWEASYYVMGGSCIPWMFLWPFLIYDRPKLHPRIRKKELDMLTETLGETGKVKGSAPWKSMLKSVPLYVLAIAHVTSGWTWYMGLTGLPMFMHMVLRYKMQENAILTALPFLTLWILSLICGKLIDYVIAEKKISVTWARKSCTIISTVVPAVGLIAICYVGEQRTTIVVLMTIVITFMAPVFSGFMLNHIDLAANYAGTLMGITNTLATLSGILVPLFVGWLTEADPTINSWRILFWVTAALNILQLVTFTIFGTGKEQKWNTVALPKDSDNQAKTE